MIVSIMGLLGGIKRYYGMLLVAMIAYLYINNINLYKKVERQEALINQVTNNYEYYENLANKQAARNHTLKLRIDDLYNTNDSIIKEAMRLKDSLKIKNKDLTNLSVIKTLLKDSVKIILPDTVKTKDFKNYPLKINNLTMVYVTKVDSLLKVKLVINNTQTVIAKHRRVYVRNYKSGWSRFWHFDWRKREVHDYIVLNTNKAIRVKETRIVDVLAD